MAKQTFDDKDRLKQIVGELKQQVPGSKAGKKDEEGISELFDELSELVAVNAANNYNICLMGGMTALLQIMVGHDSDDVRKQACQTFSSVTGNNQKVQNFALKAGAINLAAQLEREQKPAMREAILSSLSAFIKSANFEGKRQYVRPNPDTDELGGLD